MALAKATKELKQEDTCHLCQKLMTEPVSITCGHIYCQGCILTFTEEQAKVKSSQRSLGCALCSLPFQMESIRPVKQLSSLIEIIRGMQCENLMRNTESNSTCSVKTMNSSSAGAVSGHSTKDTAPVAFVEDVCQGYTEKFEEAMKMLSLLMKNCENMKLDIRKQLVGRNDLAAGNLELSSSSNDT